MAKPRQPVPRWQIGVTAIICTVCALAMAADGELVLTLVYWAAAVLYGVTWWRYDAYLRAIERRNARDG